MPCMKCANGKWKYGEHGSCMFDTLGKCQDAAAAIHAKPKENDDYSSEMLDSKGTLANVVIADA